MKIAICEDEKVYMDIVKRMTREFFLKKEIDVSFDMYTDGRIFIERMNTESDHEKTSYDLILMDIFGCMTNMVSKTGSDMIQRPAYMKRTHGKRNVRV